MLKQIIKDYALASKIKNYKLTPRSIPISAWDGETDLKKTIAFIYNFALLCSIDATKFASNTSDLLSVISDHNKIDYGKLFEMNLFYGFTEVRSSFISIHHSSIIVNYSSDNWIDEALNGHIDYIELLPLQ
jgi:hypothetical protein